MVCLSLRVQVVQRVTTLGVFIRHGEIDCHVHVDFTATHYIVQESDSLSDVDLVYYQLVATSETGLMGAATVDEVG